MRDEPATTWLTVLGKNDAVFEMVEETAWPVAAVTSSGQYKFVELWPMVVSTSTAGFPGDYPGITAMHRGLFCILAGVPGAGCLGIGP